DGLPIAGLGARYHCNHLNLHIYTDIVIYVFESTQIHSSLNSRPVTLRQTNTTRWSRNRPEPPSANSRPVRALTEVSAPNHHHTSQPIRPMTNVWMAQTGQRPSLALMAVARQSSQLILSSPPCRVARLLYRLCGACGPDRAADAPRHQ